MTALAIGLGTTAVSMLLMVLATRLRRLHRARAAVVYGAAYRFGVVAAMLSLGLFWLRLDAALHGQPTGRAALAGLFGIVLFKTYVAGFALHLRNGLYRSMARRSMAPGQQPKNRQFDFPEGNRTDYS